MSRTNNSIKNFLSNTSITLITNFLNIISRTIFIQVLGASYLGINGLFSNLLSMLSLAELGIGSAISFSLYKPIAENDEEKIAVLMNFYKKAYRIIGIIVSSIGLIMLLFLDVLVPNPGNVEQLKLIFLIYVFNTGYTYFISYKNTLLTAYQQDYLLFKSNLIFSILNISFQILILYITRAYILYLCTNSVILLIQRIYINNFITNKYDFLKRKM